MTTLFSGAPCLPVSSSGLTTAATTETTSLGPRIACISRNRAGNFIRPTSVQNHEPSLSDDASLIAATLAGDSAAFGRLVRQYQDRLYNSLLRVLGSADDAADIAQDAFVQAYVKLDSFRGGSAFYTWLYRIAFNLAMSQRRREHKQTSLEQMKSLLGAEPMDGQPTADAGV